MKTTKILYWVFNGLFAFVMFGSAIPDVMSSPDAVRGMHTIMGYPLYFVPFIGVAKMLGVIAILIPGFPRIKEWAYAGLTFDLIAATLIFLALAAAAYIYYHKKLALTKQA